MLKLLLATVAVVSSWLWIKDFFSRAIDGREKFTSRDFALRGLALVVSLVWFIFAVFGVIGGLAGWVVMAAIVGISVKVLAGGLRLSQAEPATADPDSPDPDPPAES